MVQGSGEGRARARRLLEDLAVKKAVELFVEQNEEGWGDRTYEYYNSVLDNFAKAFPSLPTELDDILTYVYYHPLFTITRAATPNILGRLAPCVRTTRPSGPSTLGHGTTILGPKT